MTVTAETPDTEPVEPVEPVEPAEPSPEEEGEEEEAAETEAAPEPEPETPPEASDTLQAAIFDKAIKRAKNYMAAIPAVLGSQAADLELCPRCTDLLPGWILPLSIKPVPDEQKVAVKLSIGELGSTPLRKDKHSSTCPDCDGEGRVDSGSKVPREKEQKCEGCNGRGWVGPRAARLAAQPQPATTGNGYTVEQPYEEQPKSDPWGRMQDDPLYGVMPGFERT